MSIVKGRQTREQIDAAMLMVAEAEEVISTCGGDMRAAVIELVKLAYDQEATIVELRQSASNGFRRHRPESSP